MRCKLKKMLYYVITVAVIIIIGAFCIVLASDENEKNIEFLDSYGWRAEPVCIEQVSYKIPDNFDEVYNNYNELQKLSGLDLSQYKGRNAIRYTYIISNFPIETEEDVRANVICVAGEPVGGDIMTVKLDGFMYSLSYLTTGK